MTRSFGDRRAVAEVSLTPRAGETVGLVGESSSGKSTLARTVTGLTHPDQGRVLLHGQPWSGAAARSRRGRWRRIQLIQSATSPSPRWTCRCRPRCSTCCPSCNGSWESPGCSSLTTSPS
ncbi:ATP-binding cassette domain-containing protein [Frankia sp. AvcI1]|uniref:ATP-binding cassette domain-containing protein n=1 Tax=Frankia sp. AvcI1 TaxID=573496 RepID=UPI0027DFB6B1|nr:ATP-binding cassette domain-containing protein [Frankia sp. AvcI1]